LAEVTTFRSASTGFGSEKQSHLNLSQQENTVENIRPQMLDVNPSQNHLHRRNTIARGTGQFP
jgi:ribosomal protein S8E